MIGHNSPPPFEAFSLHIEDLYSTASGTLTGEGVQNDAQEAAIDELMDEFRKAKKAADDQRALEKKPHDDAGKAVQAQWKPLLEKCDRAIEACKAALTPYRAKKLAAKEAEAKRLRDEAEAKAREAQAALATANTMDLEQIEQAEVALQVAQKLSVVANKLDRSSTGLRTYWEAEVTDKRAALNHYIKREPDAFLDLIQTLADRDARSTRAPVPGVIFHERKKAT